MREISTLISQKACKIIVNGDRSRLTLTRNGEEETTPTLHYSMKPVPELKHFVQT